MNVSFMSTQGANHFSPIHLKSVLEDVAHNGLLLGEYANIVNQQPHIKVKVCAMKMTEAFRNSQFVIKKQAQFYNQQILSQLLSMLERCEVIAGEQISRSAHIQQTLVNDSDQVLRKKMAHLVESLSGDFNQHYATAKALSVDMESLYQQAKSESDNLARHIEDYFHQLPYGSENAQSIMTAIDLLEESIGQALENRIAATASPHREVGEDQALSDERQQHPLSIERLLEQKRALYAELAFVSPSLVAVKKIESQLRLYSHCIYRLSGSTKRLAACWGRITNNFAIQAHQLGSQSDSNQWFKVLTHDIPLANQYWEQLAQHIGEIKTKFSDSPQVEE